MESFTWGIIGPGNIAKAFADDLALATNAHHRLGAVLSHNLEKAAGFAAEEQAPQYFDDLHIFLQQAKIDAVYIATPHPLHHQETLQCLQHRIPVLCEKPMGMNKEQVQEMVAAAEQYQTFLMEGMWVRFLPSIHTVLSLIESDTIGKVLAVKADLTYKAPADPDSRYFNPELGGGSLLDLGIYPVFLTHLLLGKPVQVQALAKLTNKGIDESCAALLNYNDGAYALIESSLVMQTGTPAVVYGEKGKITIRSPWNEKPAAIESEDYGGTTIIHPCGWNGKGLYYEAEELYDCVRQSRISSPHLCHAFSLDMIETMDTIRQQTGISYPFEQHE